jgi:hypothetical protein
MLRSEESSPASASSLSSLAPPPCGATGTQQPPAARPTAAILWMRMGPRHCACQAGTAREGEGARERERECIRVCRGAAPARQRQRERERERRRANMHEKPRPWAWTRFLPSFLPSRRPKRALRWPADEEADTRRLMHSARLRVCRGAAPARHEGAPSA